MKLYIFAYLCSLLFAFSPNCASSQAKQNKSDSLPNAAPTAAPITASSPMTNALPPKSPASDLIWKGTSGNYAVEWTKQDILAKNAAGAEVFSAKKMAAQRLNTVYLQNNFDKKGSPNFENFTFGYKIKNLFGNFLVLEESTAYSPQTYTTKTLLTIDLNDPKSALSLQNFYTSNEILRVLLENAEIKKDLQDNDVALPKTLPEFYSLFYTNAAKTTEGTDRLFDRCWFPKNILESFAFEKIEPDSVEIELGMPCAAGMREDEFFPLKLTFPVSEKLKKSSVEIDRQQLQKIQTQIAAINEEANIGFDAKSFKKSK